MKPIYLDADGWSARSGRVPSIDGIRAICIMLVLAGHIVLPAGFGGFSALGLKTFFFISGFLITRLLLGESKATGRIDLRGFYARRVLRLYPAIIALVLVCTLVAVVRGQEVRAIDLIAVFLYFVNYLVIFYRQIGDQMSLPVEMLWSLSIEEHFYLFAPLAMMVLHYSAKKMAIFALAVCVMSQALRMLYAHENPAIVEGMELYWRSETRFDCIAYGMLLACLTEFGSGRKLIQAMTGHRIFIGTLMLLALTFAIRGDYFQRTWRFSLQGILLIPIVASVVFAQPFGFINRFLNLRPMEVIGALSYSLYVWHGAVPFLLGPWLKNISDASRPWTHLLVSVAFAVVSYRFVERPIVAWRQKMRNRARQAAAAINAAI